MFSTDKNCFWIVTIYSWLNLLGWETQHNEGPLYMGVPQTEVFVSTWLMVQTLFNCLTPISKLTMTIFLVKKYRPVVKSNESLAWLDSLKRQHMIVVFDVNV